MAHIRIEMEIDASPEEAWPALRDWGSLHERLAPGFAVDLRLDGEDRIVTFFNGAVLREVLLDTDDDARRLAWSIVDGPYKHHNASAQVFDEDGRTRLVWTADVLPHDAGPRTRDLMLRGAAVIKQTLEDHGATGRRRAGKYGDA